MEASESDWPKKAYRAVLDRWKQMPRGGWSKTLSFYCERFNTKIKDTLFKKKAKETLIYEAGNLTRVREFNEGECAKRIKTIYEIFKVASLKETAIRGKINKTFIEEWARLSKIEVTKAEPTRTTSSLKKDTKVIEYLNDSVGSFYYITN